MFMYVSSLRAESGTRQKVSRQRNNFVRYPGLQQTR